MKYPLELINDTEFENLVISICQKILGFGAIGFTEGRDGGRDAKFSGTAQSFPSKASPWSGKFIIQAKHTNKPYSSCSDSDFTKIIDSEILKVKRLKDNKEIDYYLIFTNRRLTGQKDSDIIKRITEKTNISNAVIIANDTIQNYLTDNPEIVKKHGLQQFLQPLVFFDQDICDVITSFPSGKEIIKELDKKWLYVPKEKKNQLNNLKDDYFNNVLKYDIIYFEKIRVFLEDPANQELKDKYNNTIHDLRAKIVTYSSQYKSFEQVFDILFDYIFYNNKENLKEKRQLIRVFLHYMYFTCDIGRKEEKKYENI